jgi:hypothetical protein
LNYNDFPFDDWVTAHDTVDVSAYLPKQGHDFLPLAEAESWRRFQDI